MSYRARATLGAMLGVIAFSLGTLALIVPTPTTVYAQTTTTTADTLDVPSGQIGTKTATADTAISGVIGPFSGRRARVIQIMHIPAGTTHSAYAMIPQSSTTVASDAAVSQAVLTLTAVPSRAFSSGQVPASGDWVVFKNSNNKYSAAKVSSLSGNALTLGTNVDATYSGFNVLAGSPLYFYGPVGDHALYKFVTGNLYTVRDDRAGLATTNNRNEPALVVVDNITAAGNLIFATGVGIRTP